VGLGPDPAVEPEPGEPVGLKVSALTGPVPPAVLGEAEHLVIGAGDG
jgi:hypothetical protein